MNKGTTFLIGLLGGACVGALAAVALTPRTGAETRFAWARKAGSIAGEAEAFAGDVPANVKKAVQGVRSKGGSQADTTSDELRAKIEEARQRIAAEAAKKAE